LQFVIVYTNRAVKDISSFDQETKERIREALERYSESPLSHAKKMSDSSLGTYRFRIGDYRVIFDIEDHDIIILRAGHRQSIYRKR
jgi:mRNA interferase RelE/StbE